MLRKLIKHEFRATARVMGPLFLIMLALALTANLSLRFMLDSKIFIISFLGGLLLVAFTVGLFAMIIMSIVLMVNRFRTNLMGDEGYIMFTLPVSSHKLVWSKIIVSSVWFIAAGVVDFFAGMIAFCDLDVLRDIFSSASFTNIVDGFAYLLREYGVNVPLAAAEILLLCLLGCAVMCLQFYAALAVGHGFDNHKMALSVAFFFGIQFAFQFLGGMVTYAIDRFGMFYWDWDLTSVAETHLFLGVCILAEALVGGVYYLITTVMLNKRLNLQ